jgi:RNA polymerase sigma-70 factor (ECF subfamily)
MDALTAAFVRFRDRGDAEALGRVFDGLAPRLLALALHLSGHPADAEDLVQQTFVQAMRNAAQFEPARPLEPWLCGLLANLARNHRRREGHRHGATLHAAELPSGEAGPASAAERGELIALLHTRIDALPLEQRQCLLLQLQHGLSPAEIADVLAVPAGTVRMRIHRGLAALRRLLPAGLASWLHAATATPRGLATVRSDVLATARSLAPAGAAAATAVIVGVAAWKPLVLAASAVALLLFVGLQIAPHGAVPAVGANANAIEPASTAAVADSEHGAPTSQDEARDARDELQRTSIAATGALHVRVVGTAPGEPSWPLEGVPVRLRGTEDRDGRATRLEHTDRDGNAAFGDVPPGAWHVSANCLMAEQEQTCTLPAQQPAAVELQLAFTRRVRGIVVDARGAPVEGAEVWSGMAIAGYCRPAALVAHCAARTDAGGRFTAELGTRFTALGARKPGLAAAWSMLDPEPGPDDIVRLELGEPAGAITGTASDADGRPHANATIVVQMTDHHSSGPGTFPRRRTDGQPLGDPVAVVTFTDASGRFTVEGLRAGEYWCIAQDDRSECMRRVVVTAEHVAAADLVFGGSLELRSTVQRPDGGPVRNVRITIRDDQGNVAADAYTSSDGTCARLQVPARPLHVEVRRKERLLAERDLAPPFPSPLVCTFVVDEPLAARGVLVADDGRPLAGWFVRAATGIDMTAIITDARGAFAIWGSVSCELRLDVGTVTNDAERQRFSFPGITPGSDGLRLVVPDQRLPAATVVVRIVDEQGQPVPDTSATLLTPQRVPFEPSVPPDRGTFRYEDLPSGDLVLEVHAPACVAVRRELALHAGANDVGELRLLRAALLRVRPRTQTGGTIVGAPPRPQLRDAGGAHVVPWPYAHRDGDSWVFDGLAAGCYQLVVNGMDGVLAAPLPVELRVDQETCVDWPTAIGLSIECTFAPTAGAIADGDPLRVTLRDANSREVPLHNEPWRNGDHWTLAQTFALGDYEISAQSSRGERWHTTLHVRDLQHDPTQVEVPPQR